jgi:hypothetical protein
MPQKFQRSTSDIDPDTEFNAKPIKDLAIRTLTGVQQALRQSNKFTGDAPEILSGLLQDMVDTHKAAFQTLLAASSRDAPFESQALSLVRSQVETALIMFLFVEDPAKWSSEFQKDLYRKIAVLKYGEGELTADMPRFAVANEAITKKIEEGKQLFGITDPESEWIKHRAVVFDEKAPTSSSSMATFPTPSFVAKHFKDTDQFLCIMRLYLEYERLCSFSHPTYFRLFMRQAMFDDRIEVAGMIEQESTNAFIVSIVAMAVAASEILPALGWKCEMDTVVNLDDLWQFLIKSSLIGGYLWEVRYEALLPKAITA